jgi:DNA-directed RNA polymerase subunit RPC12/RpoP
MIDKQACPACNGKRMEAHERLRDVYTCKRCGAVFGTCYLGESYEIVLPYFTKEDVPSERLRYFDLTCIGSKGLTRRHGWYDAATRRIVQVG